MPFTAPMAGVSRKGLYTSVRRGDTKLIQPGVFIAASAWPNDEVERHVVGALARQLRSPYMIASHQTAALPSKLPLLNTVEAALAQPRFTREPGPGVRSSIHPRVAVRDLPSHAVTDLPAGVARGLQMTTPARTALDLAAELPLPESLMLTDAVARRSLQELAGERAFDRHIATPGLHMQRRELSQAQWQAALRPLELAKTSPIHRRPEVLLALRLTDPLRDSPPESFSFGAFVLAGLPLPECQVWFHLSDGVARVDFYWPEFGLVGECDGFIKYNGTFDLPEKVFEGQNVREEELRALGLSVVRWTAKEALYFPGRVVERVTVRLLGCGWDGRPVT